MSVEQTNAFADIFPNMYAKVGEEMKEGKVMVERGKQVRKLISMLTEEKERLLTVLNPFSEMQGESGIKVRAAFVSEFYPDGNLKNKLYQSICTNKDITLQELDPLPDPSKLSMFFGTDFLDTVRDILKDLVERCLQSVGYEDVELRKEIYTILTQNNVEDSDGSYMETIDTSTYVEELEKLTDNSRWTFEDILKFLNQGVGELITLIQRAIQLQEAVLRAS